MTTRRNHAVGSGVAVLAVATAAVWIRATRARASGPGRLAAARDAWRRNDRVCAKDSASAAAVTFASDPPPTRRGGLIRELTASRARILAAADDERRRIEKDLHDGAQQRLVALRIHLELAAERAGTRDLMEAAALHSLGAEVDEALEDMRRLTRGIYPTLLADRGLGDAVRALALRSPVPTRVEVVRLGAYPPEIATAVYFCCAEALQNVAKHARGATLARISLAEERMGLRFSVCDNGPGIPGSEARVGAGIVNMQDRMATIGGRLELRSGPGEGFA